MRNYANYGRRKKALWEFPFFEMANGETFFLKVQNSKVIRLILISFLFCCPDISNSGCFQNIWSSSSEDWTSKEFLLFRTGEQNLLLRLLPPGDMGFIDFRLPPEKIYSYTQSREKFLFYLDLKKFYLHLKWPRAGSALCFGIGLRYFIIID